MDMVGIDMVLAELVMVTESVQYVCPALSDTYKNMCRM